MLGLLALGVVAVTGWRWFRLIKEVAIPRNRSIYMAGFVCGGLIGLVAAFGSSGLVSTIAGGLAAFGGLTFAALRMQSAQRPNEPAVSVGGTMLAFSAPDETGADFDLSKLAGKPYLLKFFRGHW